MRHGHTLVRCLFCRATVVSDHKRMFGWWYAPDDLTPKRRHGEDRAWSKWLWYGAGSPEEHQDFYLCPEHNDRYFFHAAMGWAAKQLSSGTYVYFSDIQESPMLSPENVGRWVVPNFTLLDKVPDLSNSESSLELPNRWQIRDPRIHGCLDISWVITDVFDGTLSPLLLDALELDSQPPPLELAEAMKKVVQRIERITEKRE